TFFEFTELIGIGTQEVVPLSDRFTGVWKGRGVNIELAQDGATVAGCYDKENKLTGTVDGTVLRAVGKDRAGVVSHFIAVIADDGTLRGLRSTNGAPFKPYAGAPDAGGPVCLPPEPPSIGCGDIVHGIRFDFDSDVIRPESDVVLAALFDGLVGAQAGRIEIVGHSSAEGAADYNRALSQRRAASVVGNLVARGLPAARLAASGMGEDVPIASNADEAGRSMNRRVEIRCSG
ncbi:MAG: OmpA family protein, partial [Pseudomonadota bacterium]